MVLGTVAFPTQVNDRSIYIHKNLVEETYGALELIQNGSA